MKIFSRFVSEKKAEAASRLICCVCYFLMLFCAICLVLSFMGRQSFTLCTGTGVYENAIYAEADHDASSRGVTVSMTGDNVRVSSADEVIDPAIQVGLSLMYAVHMVPLIIAYWFLSRVFANVARGEIFAEKNAAYLLYYGLIRFAAALLVPLIKILICALINLVSVDSLSIGTGSMTVNDFIVGIAFMVAAYMIHYGISLQDEVDHTL